jgi:hypothetical protein
VEITSRSSALQPARRFKLSLRIRYVLFLSSLLPSSLLVRNKADEKYILQCPSCEHNSSLDLSLAAFEALDANLDDGIFDIEWWFTEADEVEDEDAVCDEE